MPDIGRPTTRIVSDDPPWRAEIQALVEELQAVVLSASDGSEDGPCGLRLEDNRWEGEPHPGLVLRVGVDPTRPFDLPWPLELQVLDASLRTVSASLRSQGLLRSDTVAQAAFQRLVSLSADSIEVVDERVRLLYVNPAFEQITGYSMPEVLGRTTGDLFRAGTHDPTFYQQIMKTLGQGETWRGQLVARRQDGDLSYQESVLAPFWSPDGERLGYVALKRDLARDELLNRAAGNQDAQRAALFREVADAFLLHDRDGRLLDRNDRAIRLFRLDEQVEGRAPGLLDRIVPEDAKRLLTSWRNLVGANPVTYDADMQPLDSGPTRTLSFSSVRVSVAGEDLILSVARDITDRVLLEKKARALNQANLRIQTLSGRLAEERQQEKAARLDSLSVLAGSLAHDLNNALAVITGNIDVLNDSDSEEERREILDDIGAGLRSAQDITRRFTGFSRGASAVLSPLDLRPLLREIARSFSVANNVEVHFHTVLNEALCNADEHQLGQVILNLLVNAHQAAGSDTAIDVRLGAEQDDFYTIRVEDHGPGIPEVMRDRVFEPFVSTKPGGSGLGLASAQRIVEGHLGRIEATPRDGGGTCIAVHLPRTRVKAKQARELTHATSKTVEKPLADLTVLVMDDEPAVLFTLGRILRGQGATIEMFPKGEALLAAYRDLPHALRAPSAPVIVLLDLLIVDGMGGVETLQHLRAMNPAIRAIACSGHPPDPSITDYETVGFLAYLKKPFSADALTRTVLQVAKGPAPAAKTKEPPG